MDTPIMTANNQQDELVGRLIPSALSGDEAACFSLYQIYVSLIYRVVYGVLLNQEDTEEVVQDTFVYAFRNLKRYDSQRSSMKTWLYTIAMSRCRNKRRRIQPLTAGLVEIGDWLASSDPQPEHVTAQNQAREALIAALQKLSPKLREAVILRYYGGLSYREIAEVVHCPQKTAESRVRLAHKELFHMLADQYDGVLQGFFGYEQA